MPTKLRVGAVNYLNTKPLIERLTELAPEIELQLDLPSRLADRLAAGELDVGLIPVIEYFRGRRVHVRPGHRHRLARAGAERDAVQPRAVAGDSPVCARRGLADERRADADPAPQAARRDSRGPAAADGAPRRGGDDRRGAAHRRPGDAGLPAGLPLRLRPRPGVDALDRPAVGLRRLGGARRRRTRRDRGRLPRAKEHGLARAGAIAEREAAGLGLDAGFCRRYLDTHPLRPRPARTGGAAAVPRTARNWDCAELAARAVGVPRRRTGAPRRSQERHDHHRPHSREGR